MPDNLFRILLDLFMVSDPWPLDNAANDALGAWLDFQSRERGFPEWVTAFHEFEVSCDH